MRLDPTPIRRRMLSKNVENAVVSANLVEDSLWVVPLIERGLDLVLPSSQPEPHGSFIGLVAGVTFHC